MKRTLTASVMASLLFAVALPGSASAWQARESVQWRIISKVDTNRDEIRENRQVVRDEMQTTRDAIFEALRSHSGEQSAYQDKQIEASRRIADAEQQNASQRLRQQFRAKAESGEMDPSPDMCLLADAFSGASSRSGGGAAGSQAASNVQRRLSGEDPDVRAGGTQLAKAVVDDRRRLSGAFGKADATTDASILVGPSLDLSNPQNREALDRLMMNMANPYPDQPVTAQEMQLPGGVDRAREQTVKASRVNSSLSVLAMTANMRDEVMDRTETWDAFLEDIGAYNRDYGDRLSEMEQLEIRILRDYAPSQERFSKRAVLNERGLLQQMIEQMSVNNRLAYISLELDARRAVLETQILSALAN